MELVHTGDYVSQHAGACCWAGAGQDPYHGEGMAQYVFGRLLGLGRRAELLSLPDDFNKQLLTWLLQQVLHRCLRSLPP